MRPVDTFAWETPVVDAFSASQPLVADDLRAGRLAAPWGFSQTRAVLALWVPRRAADGRAEQLAQWLRAELGRQQV